MNHLVTLEEVLEQVRLVRGVLDMIPPGSGYPDGCRLDDLKKQVALLAGCIKALCQIMVEKEKEK